jgi:hypothetical protein
MLAGIYAEKSPGAIWAAFDSRMHHDDSNWLPGRHQLMPHKIVVADDSPLRDHVSEYPD